MKSKHGVPTSRTSINAALGRSAACLTSESDHLHPRFLPAKTHRASYLSRPGRIWPVHIVINLLQAQLCHTSTHLRGRI